MVILNIASKANQATCLPALLVTSLANDLDAKTSIDITFHEVESLKTGEELAVDLAVQPDKSICSSEQAISYLLENCQGLPGRNDGSVSQ